MVYEEQPDNFNSSMEVAGCFLNHDSKFLVLCRQDHKPQGNTWGIPSGKLEIGETKEDAIIREFEEETGYKIESRLLHYFKKLYVRYNSYDFIYHIFNLEIDHKPDVILDKSGHKDFKWVTPEESLQINYIEDLDACVKLFYGIK